VDGDRISLDRIDVHTISELGGNSAAFDTRTDDNSIDSKNAAALHGLLRSRTPGYRHTLLPDRDVLNKRIMDEGKRRGPY